MIDEASRQSKAYGEQGWEIVGSSVQRVQVARHFSDYDKGGDHYFEWSIVCTLKTACRARITRPKGPPACWGE